jgi:hypothetical protein
MIDAYMIIKPALLVSLLFIVSAQAFADTKDEIAKCAAAPTGLKRLACFDELTQKLGIKIPKEAEVAKTYDDPQKQREKQTEQKQVVRKKFIEDAIKYEVIQKITTPGDYPHVWVKQAFYQMDFDMKQNLAAVVYDYYKMGGNSQLSLVIFKDSRTGKSIGNYSPKLGLDLD